MRLWSLTLKNFIGIYNGLGKTEITIPFYKCINQIVIIKGDNGSGKSTVFKALHPFADASNSFIPDKNASKSISYRLDNGDIFHLKYEYKMMESSRKTTCEVVLEKQDGSKITLNPNKNVRDAKEIICNYLDIDPGFLTLAQLSSDDRGLADKLPSERKKFINSKISELDAFNEIYKKVTKRSSQLHGMVNSISAKLSSLGDIHSIQNDIVNLTNQMGSIEDEKVQCIADLSKLQVLYEGVSQSEELMNSLRTRLQEVNSKLKKYTNLVHVTPKSIEIQKEEMQKLIVEKSSLQQRLEDLSKQRGSISEKLTSKSVKLESLDLSSLEEIESKIKNIQEQKQYVDERFRSLGLENYADITVDEYEYALSTLYRLQDLKEQIRDSSNDMAVLDTACNLVITERAMKYSMQELNAMQDELNAQVKLSREYEIYQEQCEGYDTIPSDCNHKEDCPFIHSIVKSKEKALQLEQKLRPVDEILAMQKQCVEYKKNLEIETKATPIASLMVNFLDLLQSASRIIKKFPVKVDSQDKDILNAIIYGNSVGIEIDLTPYREYKNLFAMSKSYQKDIDGLMKQYAELAPNKELIYQLQNDIVELQSEYDTVTERYNTVEGKLKNITLDIEDLTHYINSLEANLEATNQENQLLAEKEQIEKDMAKADDEYTKAIRMELEMKKTKSRLDEIVSSILPDLQNKISQCRYRLTLYDNYTKEYNEYAAEYNKIEVIKKYCSPTTGIQTVFMEMYMNKAIGISNQLLSMLFRGEYVLQPFVINEKEFRMPVLGSGIMNDDISSMSTSQICMISMILSFALLRQSSSIYNIIKIDELEGGLDTQNRLAFFKVLLHLMDTLQCEQCVMISHNAELNMKMMDVIILRNSDPTSAYYEGNVIYDANVK